MAVYKIFPEKDATMYSLFPQMNTGLDEILDISNLVFNLHEEHIVDIHNPWGNISILFLLISK